MENIDADELRKFLANQRLPWARFPVPAQGREEVMIQVADLRRALAGANFTVLTHELDSLVSALGGRRERVIDPWSAPQRLFAWARGGGYQTNDAYALPRQLLDDAR